MYRQINVCTVKDGQIPTRTRLGGESVFPPLSPPLPCHPPLPFRQAMEQVVSNILQAVAERRSSRRSSHHKRQLIILADKDEVGPKLTSRLHRFFRRGRTTAVRGPPTNLGGPPTNLGAKCHPLMSTWRRLRSGVALPDLPALSARDRLRDHMETDLQALPERTPQRQLLARVKAAVRMAKN